MISKKRRRKKKRKSRYHTGVHVSPKAGECCYRSGWELAYCRHLDEDPNVVSYEYEGVVVGYVSNVKSGKIRKYFPDFLVTYANGSQKLIEIKPKNRLVQPKVMKKVAAAELWCADHGAEFQIVTEVELRELGLL